MSIAKTFKSIVARTILKKVYLNDKISSSLTRRYSNTPTPMLTYQFATEKDTQRIVDFLIRNIVPTSPLFDSLGVNPKELLGFFVPILETNLKDHTSLLGFIDEKLVAVSVNSIHKFNSSATGSLDDKHVDIVPRKDYSQLIDGAKFESRAAKKVYAFNQLLHHNFEALLPGSHKVMFIDVGGVSTQYRGRGISLEMVKHIMKMAQDKFGCDYIFTVADSKPAQKMFEQKLGFKLLRELKLDYFLEGTKPVFFCEELVSGKLLCKKL